MKLKGSLIILFVLIGQLLFSQSKKEIIEQGDNAYKNENYASAAYFYKKVIDKKGVSSGLVHPYEARSWVAPAKKSKAERDSLEQEKADTNSYGDDAVVLHKLANSYRLNHDYLNAETWYAIAIKYPIDGIDEDLQSTRLWYGEALMKNEKYDEAVVQFDEFKNETPDMELSKRADKDIVGCYFAQDGSSTNEGVTVSPSDSNMNFGTSSYGVNYFGDEMTIVFSAAGPEGTIKDEKSREESKYLSDFYIAQNFMEEGYASPTNFNPPINTENNEGAGVLSIDRTTFYFTRSSAVNNKEVSIWVSKNFNNQWLDPLKLDGKVNMEGFKSMHPALSMEGDVLYFSSNRPGGLGGMDIWYCNIDDYGGLSEPINIGTHVNTQGDEVTPFFNYFTKTLYFSSDASGGIGGLDIYKTTHNEDEDSWSNPKNLGKPFNSSKDDAYYIINKNQSQGFLSSDRITCECGEEYEGSIYCYKIFQFGQPEQLFTLSGTAFNAETDEIIPNALITFKDIRGKMDPVFITTDAQGNYKRDLEVGWDLFMKAQKAKYFGDAANLSTTGLTESKHFVQDFFLTPIPLGELEIPGIEYDFDAATLRPKSKEILDKLVEFLQLNDNITIEIRSHTDSRGDDTYNLKLSKRRAASVVKYLIAHGINKKRLESKGMGETEPLDDCSKYPECNVGKEDCDCHQKNRRTAFKTTSEDFKDVFKGK
jgi:OOP family OmpA-OmpF porin